MLDKQEMVKAINEVRQDLGMNYISLENDEIDDCILYTEGSNKYYIIVKMQENGGYEGDGEYMDFTLKIERLSDGEFGYLTFEGRYDSWNDSVYNKFYVSTPVEKTITVYERIKQ